MRRVLAYGVLTPLALLWLLPVLTMVVTAVKPETQVTLAPLPWQPPQRFALWENALFAWSQGGLGHGFVNSLAYGAVGAVGAILAGSLAAYALVRLRVRGRFFWFMLIYSGTVFPFQMYLIPLFRLYIDTGLYDTRIGLMLFYAAIATPFCLFVLHNFFATIPHEVGEAATIDGATDGMVFWRFYMPLSIPALAVLFLFQFTWIWNDLLFGLVLSKSDTVRPIMPALAGLMGVYSTISIASVLAGGLIASVPTIVLFLFLQRHLVKGLTLSTAGR